MAIPGLPPPRPIPLKDRSSLVFVERAQLSALILMKLASGEIDARAIRAAMTDLGEAN